MGFTTWFGFARLSPATCAVERVWCVRLTKMCLNPLCWQWFRLWSGTAYFLGWLPPTCPGSSRGTWLCRASSVRSGLQTAAAAAALRWAQSHLDSLPSWKLDFFFLCFSSLPIFVSLPVELWSLQRDLQSPAETSESQLQVLGQGSLFCHGEAVGTVDTGRVLQNLWVSLEYAVKLELRWLLKKKQVGRKS